MNMQLLGKLGTLQKLEKGTVLIKEGEDASKGMIYLLQGELGIFKNYGTNSQHQADTLTTGSYFGEDSLFLGKARAFSLVALGPSVVLFINRSNVNDYFRTQPEMAYTLVQRLTGRVEDLTTQLSKLSGTEETQASQYSTLFPEGHGSYTLPLTNRNEDYLYVQTLTCPMCAQLFDSLTVIVSKLRVDGTDTDLRTRYKDIEPLYYDVVTCPNCFFSALYEQFSEVSKRWAADIAKQIGPYRLELYVRPGLERDTFSVFAGYYLTNLCIPFIAENWQLARAANWNKISRLYQDVDDENMRLYASRKALEDYLYSYQHFNIPPKSLGQITYIIGDLYHRLGELEDARTFFYYVKTNKEATTVIRRQADNRLEEIKIILKELAAKNQQA
ncbi:MAG: DUF2225 domain-containing protein [Oscillospiraceae bacterium]|nr:DUF2225 domain-containing protein [Oscillospiraceae bacterium]